LIHVFDSRDVCCKARNKQKHNISFPKKRKRKTIHFERKRIIFLLVSKSKREKSFLLLINSRKSKRRRSQVLHPMNYFTALLLLPGKSSNYRLGGKERG
jgi:hypothetical protein